jgi:hypothetical protein
MDKEKGRQMNEYTHFVIEREGEVSPKKLNRGG